MAGGNDTVVFNSGTQAYSISGAEQCGQYRYSSETV